MASDRMPLIPCCALRSVRFSRRYDDLEQLRTGSRREGSKAVTAGRQKASCPKLPRAAVHLGHREGLHLILTGRRRSQSGRLLAREVPLL